MTATALSKPASWDATRLTENKSTSSATRDTMYELVDSLLKLPNSVPVFTVKRANYNLQFKHKNFAKAPFLNSEDTSFSLYVSMQHHLTEASSTKVSNDMSEIIRKRVKILEDAVTRIHTNEKFWNEALEELGELGDEAAECGITPPTPVAKKLARKMLGILISGAPRHYSVSLWEDGDVIIYSGNAEWRVSVYCRANGGASFYVSSPGNHDHDSHYQSAQDMPMEPIIDALNKIPT